VRDVRKQPGTHEQGTYNTQPQTLPLEYETLGVRFVKWWRQQTLGLTRDQVVLFLRRPMIAIVHACLAAAAWIGSFAIRLDFGFQEPYRSAMLATLPVVIVIKLAVFYAFKLFQGWWKYVGLSDLIDIAKATGLATVCLILALLAMYGTSMAIGSAEYFPRSVVFLDMVLTFLLLGGVRFAVRAYTETFRYSTAALGVRRVLVVGAGRTGMTIVREMRVRAALRQRATDPPSIVYRPVAFVDDDPNKQGLRVDGVPVLGMTTDIPALLTRLEVDEVLLAFSSRSGRDIRRIMDACHDRRVIFKTMPSVSDLIDGRISVNRIREVRIDDLLGREPISINLGLVRSNTEGHIILVTGAAGSIGSELSRQIAMLGPARLILFERSESDLHDLELALRDTLPNVEVSGIVGDILDSGDLAAAFEQHRPSRIYHAAAYKHVALMERHVVSAVRNNVLGTYNVATMAKRFGAEQVVLISTDKAVRPTSLMGASKRAAERVVLSMNGGRTRFTAVRFGNVLGSRGSVVPIFRRQIERGGPVTVTHPEVVRFFMTIPEAVQLVLQAAASSHGGDIFHLDMGEPVRIADLAENMIRLSGFEPGRDIEVKFVGLRPGEKLYEELLIDGEDIQPTEHPRVRSVRTTGTGISSDWIEALLRAVDSRDASRVVSLVCSAVPEFTPSDLVLPPGMPTIARSQVGDFS
jgi:FlaA1/EpsC-like NDP-sugar epimerase